MAVGEAITLTIGGPYYDASNSKITLPLDSGTVVYVQADSIDPTTSYGAVLEGHEITGGAYNNIFGPGTTPAIIGPDGVGLSPASGQNMAPVGDLPPRN